MSCGLARFNDGPSSAVMKEEDLWGDIINFMWSKIIMFDFLQNYYVWQFTHV